MDSSVYVIIVTYNRAHLLKLCVDAVLHQTCPPTKIIIVDNGSTDDTVKVIGEIISSSPSVIHLRFTSNIGGSGGFYEGINLAMGKFDDWLWLMDDDALPDLNAFENSHMQNTSHRS
jgi:GT2 family glycosyltransferase